MFALGCADFHRGPAPRDSGPDRSQDTTLVFDFAFETSVYPILQIRCQYCHSVDGQGRSTGLVLTGNARLDRAMVVALVVPGAPDASLLLRRATGEAHTGRDVLAKDSAEYEAIANWIMGLPAPSQP
jgi:hypothetical protein